MHRQPESLSPLQLRLAMALAAASPFMQEIRRAHESMREACRMGHMDADELESATATARKAERDAWLADMAALAAELADA